MYRRQRCWSAQNPPTRITWRFAWPLVATSTPGSPRCSVRGTHRLDSCVVYKSLTDCCVITQHRPVGATVINLIPRRVTAVTVGQLPLGVLTKDVVTVAVAVVAVCLPSGVLTKGVLDNGRGAARLQVFRHKHEVDSGRTSAISQQVMIM